MFRPILNVVKYSIYTRAQVSFPFIRRLSSASICLYWSTSTSAIEFFDTIWRRQVTLKSQNSPGNVRKKWKYIKQCENFNSWHTNTKIDFIVNLFKKSTWFTDFQHSFHSYCRLGPRELNISVEQWITDNLPPNTSNSSTSLLSQQQQQSSHQSKIMNVVVPNVACPPAAAKKIRRKPENKVSRVNPDTKT